MSITAEITVHPDGSGVVALGGRSYPLAEDDEQTARHIGVGLVIDHARRIGEPINLTAHDRRSDHHLLVTADGDVLPASPSGTATTAKPPTPGEAVVLPAEPPTHRTPRRRAARPIPHARALLIAGIAAIATAGAVTAITLRPAPEAVPQAQAPVRPSPTAVIVAGAPAPTPAKPTLPLRLTATRGWTAAANWQAQVEAQAAAANRRARTTTPVTPGGQQLQVQPAPITQPGAPQPPAQPAAPTNRGPDPSVVINPDPRPGSNRPSGGQPPMPDQPLRPDVPTGQ